MDNKLSMTIGERIGTLLRKKGIKQKELAQYLGITDNTISYFCSGSRTPNTAQIKQIAEFFGTSTDYLFGLSEADTTDTETKAICDYIGLSDEAIQIIRGNAYGNDIREIINFFLQSSNMLDESFSRSHAFILFCKSFMGYKRALEYSNDFYKQYFDMHIDPTALSTEESKGLIHDVMTGTDRVNAAEYQIQKQAAKMAELFCGNLIKENTELNKQFALDGVIPYEQIEEGEQYGSNQETQ